MGQSYIVRFDEGENIMEALEKFAKERNIEYANFVKATGSITDFTITTTGSNASINTQTHKRQFKVNAISGKIQKTKQGNYKIDLNMALSGVGVGSINGTIVNAKAGNFLEMTIKTIDLSKMIEA